MTYVIQGEDGWLDAAESAQVIPWMGGGRMDAQGARYVLAHRDDYTHETITDALFALGDPLAGWMTV